MDIPIVVKKSAKSRAKKTERTPQVSFAEPPVQKKPIEREPDAVPNAAEPPAPVVLPAQEQHERVDTAKIAQEISRATELVRNAVEKTKHVDALSKENQKLMVELQFQRMEAEKLRRALAEASNVDSGIEQYVRDLEDALDTCREALSVYADALAR